MSSELFVPAASIFAAAVFATLSLVLLWETFSDWRKRRKVMRRLGPVLDAGADDDPMAGAEAPGRRGARERQGEEGSLFRTGSEESVPALVRAASRLPGFRRLKRILRQSGSSLSLQAFLMTMAGLGVGAGGAVFIVTGSLPLGMLGAVVAGVLPYLHLRRRMKRRLASFEEQFPEAIDLLTRAIRAGHPLSAGFRMVGDEGPEAVSREFRRTFEEHRYGLAFQDALLGLVDRVDLVDVRIFATAVLIQRDVGGNLAEILDTLAETIRQRFTVRRQLRVYTAQGRMSGFILGALPIVVGLAIFAIEPSYIRLLFEETLGRVLLVMAATMQVIGYVWIRKIVNIEI